MIKDCQIYGNSANDGGGVYVRDGSLSIVESVVSENVANAYGGGVATYNADLLVAESTISGNAAGSGGGISYSGYGLKSAHHSQHSQR